MSDGSNPKEALNALRRAIATAATALAGLAPALDTLDAEITRATRAHELQKQSADEQRGQFFELVKLAQDARYQLLAIDGNDDAKQLADRINRMLRKLGVEQ